MKNPGRIMILPWVTVASLLVSAADPSPTVPNVGMEGQILTNLPGSLLETVEFDRRSPLQVRIADHRPHGELTRYDLRFVGFVPGSFDLRSQLRRQDGSSMEGIPSLPVQVAGLLPPEHSGELIDLPPSAWKIFGGYRIVMGAVAAAWFLAGLLWWGRARRKSRQVTQAVTMPEPTLAERLHLLIEQSLSDRSSVEARAQLERALVNYWREKLNLSDTSFGNAVGELKKHPEAGALLRALEDWLHRPPGSGPPDIQAILAPYRRPAGVAPREVADGGSP